MEIQPLLPPSDGNVGAIDLWDQLPDELKNNGFGYYMNRCETINYMSDYELYWSYLANYYYFNRGDPSCSFDDWQHRVLAKFGSYRTDVVDTSVTGFAKAAVTLFNRQQLVYYGW